MPLEEAKLVEELAPNSVGLPILAENDE